ncbi:MAG: hypothetical protein SYR96_35625 [Actinomycetota bacterium]|nr:hypothetical protein [Actinomycetota bacterium]
MGKSGWQYVTSYEWNLDAVLDGLRRRVFESGEYYWPPELDRPTSLEEFDAGDAPEGGTHSILDIVSVVGPRDEDGWRTLRPLTAAETVRVFGTGDPTRADFERSGDARWAAGPPLWWCGYAVALTDGSDLTEVGIWGFSGS